MAKKSRKTAVKYSQLSKTKKKKPKNGVKNGQRAVSTSYKSVRNVEEVADTTRKTSSESRQVPKSVSAAQEKAIQSLPRYDYVRDDLKRIGMLSGAIIVILIILTFVLG